MDSQVMSNCRWLHQTPHHSRLFGNEELVLMWAEANISFDNAATVTAIDKVRGAAGLGIYAGATDDAALLDQLLHERRYSRLW